MFCIHEGGKLVQINHTKDKTSFFSSNQFKCLASTNKKPERVWSDTINQESGRLGSRAGGSTVGECKEEADEEAVDDAYAEIIESHARTRLVSVEDDGGRRRRYDACRL